MLQETIRKGIALKAGRRDTNESVTTVRELEHSYECYATRVHEELYTGRGERGRKIARSRAPVTYALRLSYYDSQVNEKDESKRTGEQGECGASKRG